MSSWHNRILQDLEDTLEAIPKNISTRRDKISHKVNNFFEKIEGAITARQHFLMDVGRYALFIGMLVVLFYGISTTFHPPETPEQYKARMHKLQEEADQRRQRLLREQED